MTTWIHNCPAFHFKTLMDKNIVSNIQTWYTLISWLHLHLSPYIALHLAFSEVHSAIFLEKSANPNCEICPMKSSKWHLSDRMTSECKTHYLVHLFQNKKVMATRKKTKEQEKRLYIIYSKTYHPEICLSYKFPSSEVLLTRNGVLIRLVRVSKMWTFSCWCNRIKRRKISSNAGSEMLRRKRSRYAVVVMTSSTVTWDQRQREHR